MSDFDSQPGSATPTPEPSAPAAPTPTADPQAPAPAIPSAPAPPQQPQVPSGYVPSFRLREITERANQAQQHWQQQEARYQHQLNEAQRQRDALLGIAPKEDPQNAEVRNQFAQLFPRLAKYEQMGVDPEQLQTLLQRAGDVEAQQQHYWQSYGRQSMDRLFEKASTTLGGPLSNEAKTALHSAFTGYVSSSPELAARYASDPSLIEEFWQNFSTNFIEPARRVAGASVLDRAGQPVPQNTPGNGIRVSPAPQMNGMDDRVNAAWAQYQQMKKV